MISILAAILGMALFLLLAAAFGHRLISPLLPQFSSDSEQLLYCLGAGVAAIELLTIPALFAGNVRIALVAVSAFVFLLGVARIPVVIRTLSLIIQRILSASTTEKLLLFALSVVVLIEFLSSMAPLTASDALHYHFTVPAQILQNGFHPNLFLSNSLFCGQSHLLILLGLALGGERLAMGIVFLGGILAAIATASLARRWTSRSWAYCTALIFLLTPVVFWQIASPGAPDLWMAFFTILTVLLISKVRESGAKLTGVVVLAGCFTGVVAGAKYTGCFVAFALLLALFVELRSFSKALLFTTAAVFAGCWHYLRNIVWAGDPFFPFLLPRLSPHHVNATALVSYLADTGKGAPHNPLQFLEFISFTRVDPGSVGFFQFFGPLVLAFSPLLLRTVRNTSLWRVCLITWIVFATIFGLRSGLIRYLLAVFPLALAAVMSAVFSLKNTPHRLFRFVSVSSIAIFLSAGFFGLLVYAKKPVKASLGFVSREDYLRQYSPDYQADVFANQFFADHPANGKVLVFMRHLYYLKIPYLYGDPRASWPVNPSALQTPEQWRAFFAANNIDWVLRNPIYPPHIASAMIALEKSGDLIPVARTEVENFYGMRILDVRERSEVVILKVNRQVKSE